MINDPTIIIITPPPPPRLTDSPDAARPDQHDYAAARALIDQAEQEGARVIVRE